MHTRSKLLGYSVAAAMMFVFTSAACAQLPEGDQAKRGKHWEARFNEIIKELNLTPEQQQAINQQRTQEKARSQELRQKIKTVRDNITLELNKEVTDTAKLKSLLVELKDFTGERIEQQIKGIISLKSILSPAQFKALNEKREKNEKHRGAKK